LSYLQLPPEEEFSAAFFRQWMLLGMLLTGLVMALLDPGRWRYWAVAVGLFPVTAVAVYMVLRGPGNIWPIALALAFTIGLVPAFVGAAVGRGLRRFIFRGGAE
jgi:peptidoglycan/LPS O-acetylase OafA/YrhL